MKYTIISGSHRNPSQSFKVSEWLETELKKQDQEVAIINLTDNPFPLWSGFETPPEMKDALQDLNSSDGIIIVSPEWHGMVPAGLKNLLLHVSTDEVGHKPALLVGVSAGRGGAYPITELRSFGSKNNRMNIIPEHLIVRDVNNAMNDHDFEKGSEEDLYIKKRALFALEVIKEYAEALAPMRARGKVLSDEYKNGM